MRNALRKPRHSVATALALAGVVFLPVCVILTAFARAVVIVVVDALPPGVNLGPAWDVLLLSAMVGVPMLLAYFPARVVYQSVRWIALDNSTGRWCGYCGYDLTGNVSGACPECGKQVVERTGRGGER